MKPAREAAAAARLAGARPVVRRSRRGSMRSLYRRAAPSPRPARESSPAIATLAASAWEEGRVGPGTRCGSEARGGGAAGPLRAFTRASAAAANSGRRSSRLDSCRARRTSRAARPSSAPPKRGTTAERRSILPLSFLSSFRASAATIAGSMRSIPITSMVGGVVDDGAVAVDVELRGLADVAEAVDGVDRRRRLDRVGVEEVCSTPARHMHGTRKAEAWLSTKLPRPSLEQLLVAEPGHRAVAQRDVVFHHQQHPKHREEHRRLPTLDVARGVDAEEVREHEERRGVVEHVAEERPPRELRTAGGGRRSEN